MWYNVQRSKKTHSAQTATHRISFTFHLLALALSLFLVFSISIRANKKKKYHCYCLLNPLIECRNHLFLHLFIYKVWFVFLYHRASLRFVCLLLLFSLCTMCKF